jgi:hypothetical protein
MGKKISPRFLGLCKKIAFPFHGLGKKKPRRTAGSSSEVGAYLAKQD